MFSTAEDNQPAVTIAVYQGERELVQYNKMLGQFSLEGIAPARRGMPQIEVTLDIDANGILNVSAKDKNTNKENKITIKANSGLTDAEIDQMIKDAELNAEEDKKVVELVTERNKADAVVHNLEKDFETHKESLTEDEQTAVSGAIGSIKEAVKGTDKEAIVEAVTQSYTACKPLLDKVQAAQSASEAEVQPPRDAPTEEPTTDPDVVDAEFTEVKKDAE